jgi:hypothetical protein
VAFGTFSLYNKRWLAGTEPVKSISDVPQVLLNVVAIQEITHFYMMLALYTHQIQRYLILEYSKMPLNLVLCRPQIFHKSSCFVFGGASEI